MSRRWFAALGAFLVLAVGGLLVAFGRPTAPASVLRIAGLLLAGGLFVAGGLAPTSSGVAWYRLVGTADVLLGLTLAAPLPAALLGGGAADAGTLMYTVPAGIGGLTLAFIGVDWFRGGHHFDLSRLAGGGVGDS